jgi:hypothetical protein
VDGEEAGGHGCQCIRTNPAVSGVNPRVSGQDEDYAESTT